MIDTELFERYVRTFGHTFTVAYWKDRPGDRVNVMMRAALREGAPIVTDERVAESLQRAGVAER
jgi:hypothetical protein